MAYQSQRLKMGDYQFSNLGEHAVVITLGDKIDQMTHRKVRHLWRKLVEQPFAGMVEMVPTYTALTVFYDPALLDLAFGQSAYDYVCAQLVGRMKRDEPLSLACDARNELQAITIPVCYEEPFAPDLCAVADYHQLSVEDVIRIHSSAAYTVSMIGFMPGFPYLSGMSEHIATPRQDQPRSQVAAGSVGIAGQQTGIYPFASPGGWQIIGRTPLALFDVSQSNPFLLAFGDKVMFKPVTQQQFYEWKKRNTAFNVH